jgi:glycosidase
MDFPLQSALYRGLTEEEGWGSGLIRLYETLAMDFLYPDPGNLVVFPDNHDMPRFYMQLGMDADLYKLGMAYILTTRGIPQIFYGSEILMTHKGSNEHGEIRKDFPGGWEGDKVNACTGQGLSEQELRMQQFFRKLLNWRKDNVVVHHGSMIHFAPEKGVYVYFRELDGKTVMIILNKNRKDTRLLTGRFREVTGGFTRGRDVISGKIYELNEEVIVPGITPLILELE